MQKTSILPGISQQTVRTERLTVAYLVCGTGKIPIVLVHGNCSSSLFFQDFMLELTQTGQYRVYAPDMRGYGDSDALPVDAIRGVRDYSDDLATFVMALGLPAFHLFGWSLGGNIVMQYAIDHPGLLRSLCLQSTGSPFGFGGTRDAHGTPVWPDYAGSGGGTVNPAFVQSIERGDRGDDPSSARGVMNAFYFKPPFRAAPDREEIYVTSILSTRIAPGNYPGDFTSSANWPNVAPGRWGVNNALSPKYLHQEDFATCEQKPPTLWLHGADDQIVSDTSLFDMGFLGQLGAVPGWPGAEIYPPQPMKTQVRTVLEQYKANGGQYSEVMFPSCGHAPHIEKQDDVVRVYTSFIATF